MPDANRQSFAPWQASRGETIALCLAALIVTLFFGLFPSFDIGPLYVFLTSYECDEYQHLNPEASHCGIFWIAHNDAFLEFRRYINYIPLAFAISLGFLLVQEYWQPIEGKIRRLHIYMLGFATFWLGPVLLINQVIKPFWGRPRPFQTELYGGFEEFTPAGGFSDACASNCSFVSGDVASFTWMLWIVPFVPEDYRRPLFWIILSAAIIIAVLRIAVGRHYPSDVIVGGLSSLIVIALVSRFLASDKGSAMLNAMAKVHYRPDSGRERG